MLKVLGVNAHLFTASLFCLLILSVLFIFREQLQGGGGGEENVLPTVRTGMFCFFKGSTSSSSSRYIDDLECSCAKQNSLPVCIEVCFTLKVCPSLLVNIP